MVSGMQNGGVTGPLPEILNVGRETDLAEKSGENLELSEIVLTFVHSWVVMSSAENLAI